MRSWDHTCLAVSDLDRAVSFYQSAFGYEVVLENRGIRELIQQLVGLAGIRADLVQLRSPASGHILELIAFQGVPPGREDHGPTRPGAAHVAFRVKNIDFALEEVQKLGATLIGELTTFPQGRVAYCREPAGSVFELSEHHQ